MEHGVHKGCLIGCLASAGIFIGTLLALALIGVLGVRGCTEMMAKADSDFAKDALGGERPQNELQFKKVWLSGEGDADVLRVAIRGVIENRSKRGIFDSSEDMSAPTALRKIRAAIDDTSICGLYLDIDSPGGGVTMADELHDAVLRFRNSSTNRFVFVHMGDMCCSGGYYVAAPATWIMARPTTLTGSIGVIMNGLNAAELAGKIGVSSVTIASAANKDLLNPLKPVDPEHVKILERPIMHLYERFVKIVADGRRMPVEKVRPLADGRVLSAKDALANGLVDSIGHVNSAMDKIKSLAGENVRVCGYRERSGLRSLFENSLLLESADGLMGRAKSALDESGVPRAEYRFR